MFFVIKRTRKNNRNKAKSQSLPCLQSDKGQREGHQDSSLELETEEERQDHLLDETVF